MSFQKWIILFLMFLSWTISLAQLDTLNPATQLQLKDTVLNVGFEDDIFDVFNRDMADTSSGSSLGRKDEARRGKADAFLIYANAEQKNGNLVEALRYYLLAIFEYETIGDSSMISQVKTRIGDVFYSADLYEKALENYLIAELIILKKDDKDKLPGILEKTGLTYFELHKYEKALVYFQRLIDREKEADLYKNYFYMIQCYNQLNQWDKSLEYSLKILELSEQSGNIENQVIALNNTGYIYKNLKDYKAALEYLNHSLKLQKQSNLNISPTTLVNLAIVYQNKGQTEDALNYLNQAASIAEKENGKENMSEYLHLIALVYYEMGDFYNARIYNQRTLVDATKSKNGIMLEEAYLLSSKIAEAFYDYERAMEDFQNHLHIKDSLQRTQMLESNTLTETSFLVERISRETEGLWAAEEISYLELQRLKLDSANRQQELAILYQSDSIQKITIENQELEKTRALQALLYKEEQLYAQRKEKEVDSLRQIEKIQSLELETQKLVQQEQEAQIKLLDQEKRISDLNLAKIRTRNWFMMGIVVLVLIILYVVYRAFRYSKKTNKILVKQNNEIERQRDEIDYERKRSDNLLLNILPEETAEELKEKGSATPKQYELVSVLFTDFKGFTKIAEKLTPEELVAELDRCFLAFDKIIDANNLEKIKTIGDAYMCAGGIPVANKTNPVDVVYAGLKIKSYMENLKAEREKLGQDFWELRIGIHTGHVVAGVVGKNKFAYDIWGDAVNTASRMESSGIPGKVNISGDTYKLVKDHFKCSYRGKIEAKNKGEIDMYIVEGEIL